MPISGFGFAKVTQLLCTSPPCLVVPVVVTHKGQEILGVTRRKKYKSIKSGREILDDFGFSNHCLKDCALNSFAVIKRPFKVGISACDLKQKFRREHLQMSAQALNNLSRRRQFIDSYCFWIPWVLKRIFRKGRSSSVSRAARILEVVF